jgi:hypothetical protein
VAPFGFDLNMKNIGVTESWNRGVMVYIDLCALAVRLGFVRAMENRN